MNGEQLLTQAARTLREHTDIGWVALRDDVVAPPSARSDRPPRSAAGCRAAQLLVASAVLVSRVRSAVADVPDAGALRITCTTTADDELDRLTVELVALYGTPLVPAGRRGPARCRRHGRRDARPRRRPGGPRPGRRLRAGRHPRPATALSHPPACRPPRTALVVGHTPLCDRPAVLPPPAGRVGCWSTIAPTGRGCPTPRTPPRSRAWRARATRRSGCSPTTASRTARTRRTGSTPGTWTRCRSSSTSRSGPASTRRWCSAPSCWTRSCRTPTATGCC